MVGHDKQLNEILAESVNHIGNIAGIGPTISQGKTWIGIHNAYQYCINESSKGRDMSYYFRQIDLVYQAQDLYIRLQKGV